MAKDPKIIDVDMLDELLEDHDDEREDLKAVEVQVKPTTHGLTKYLA